MPSGECEGGRDVGRCRCSFGAERWWWLGDRCSLITSAFAVFFFGEFLHGGSGCFRVGCGGGASSGFADGGHLSREGGSTGEVPDGVGLIAAGIGRSDVKLGGGGDGVLVGAEEKEFPLVNVRLMADAGGDVAPGEVDGGVFQAVGEHGDDDFAGTFGFGHRGETRAEFVDGAAEGVEEGGGIAWDVGGMVEGDDFGDGERGGGDEIFVVEEDKGEAGLAGECLLFAQEMVVTLDSGADERVHGAGTIEDEGQFGELRIHDAGRFTRPIGQWLSYI